MPKVEPRLVMRHEGVDYVPFAEFASVNAEVLRLTRQRNELAVDLLVAWAAHVAPVTDDEANAKLLRRYALRFNDADGTVTEIDHG